MSIMNRLNGYKTYFAAAGLLGLSVYQFSTGHLEEGFQTLLGAAAAAGLRNAMTTPQPAPDADPLD